MKQSISIILFVLTSLFAYAQSGTITYKNTLEAPSKLEELKKTDPAKYKRYSMMFKQMNEAENQVVYTLTFNNQLAVFKAEESIAKENQMLPSPKKNTIYYYSLENKQRFYQTERSGKYFRVKEAAVDWKITNEEKMIHNYTCKKATATQTFYSYDKEGNLNEKEQLIECWFTPKIPVPYGPENYAGLPGLILSLSSQGNNYMVVDIDLKEENKKLKKPTKGNLIGEKEFALKMYKLFSNFFGN